MENAVFCGPRSSVFRLFQREHVFFDRLVVRHLRKGKSPVDKNIAHGGQYTELNFAAVRKHQPIHFPKVVEGFTEQIVTLWNFGGLVWSDAHPGTDFELIFAADVAKCFGIEVQSDL